MPHRLPFGVAVLCFSIHDVSAWRVASVQSHQEHISRGSPVTHAQLQTKNGTTHGIALNDNSTRAGLETKQSLSTPNEETLRPFPSRSHPLRLREWDEEIPKEELERSKTIKQILLDVGGGTGAGIGMTGNRALDRELLRRMQHQDKAVMYLLLMIYMFSLLLAATFSYRQAANASPVTFYADPRVCDAAMEGHDVNDFLSTFNQPPKDVQLQVSGLLPISPFMEHMFDATMQYKGGFYRIVFSFGLDVSAWLSAAPQTDAGTTSLDSSLSAEDITLLRNYLAEDVNDLGTVEIKKEVDWDGWEDLATNIKHRIHQCGFNGTVVVTFQNSENLEVFKNRPWANFLHKRLTKLIVALSMFGSICYFPYMWLYQRGPKIKSRFRITVALEEYWQLVSSKIGATGFEA